MIHIVIIGAGWYGLHSFFFLKEKYKNLKITILEQKKEIFENSSNYNQNRLHIGYHYPRSSKTRKLCKDGYKKFIKQYRNIIDFIDHNFYLITQSSIIDYETFLSIYSDDTYEHNLIENTYFKNIEGNIINTKEKIINSERAKNLFNSKLSSKDIKFNYEVKDFSLGNKITINNEIECDFVIDCTYNQLQLFKNNFIFEKTISLVFKRIDFSLDFESLTLMDGDFFSLFPRDISKEKYSLTHVKYTPIVKSNNFEEIKNYEVTEEKLLNIKKNILQDVIKYYPDFLKHFKYEDYFTSFKCKPDCNNQSRNLNIQNKNNIISVNCGKITGIYDFEKYLKEFFDNFIIEYE